MKRTFGIIICMAIIVACLVPACAFAAEHSETASVHLINPAAIAVAGDYLYVADNIEQNRAVILRFNTTDYAQSGTFELQANITNLSTNGSDALYAVCGNKVYELKINVDNQLENAKTHEFDETVVDFAEGVFTTADAQYALTNSGLLRFAQGIDERFNSVAQFNKGISSIDCLSINGIYSLTTDQSAPVKYYGTTGTTPAVTFTMTAGFVPLGLFNWNNSVAMYSANSLYFFVENPTNSYQGQPLFTDIYGDGCAIQDVAATNDTLYILNSQKKIDVFKQADGKFDPENKTTIGTDIVNLEIPTAYTSYTLVRAKGYPANIIYKSTSENSVEGIITNATEYIILGYDNDAQSRYYLVYVDGKLGWVKKSDGAHTVEDDVANGKLEKINNNIGTETVGYVAKFISLNGVFISVLPHSSAERISLSQTADNMIEVKVLQRFTEQTGDTVKEWYYISYGDGKTGFAESKTIGKFHAVSSDEEIPESLGVYKINSSLFEAVKLYASAQMTEYEVVYDANDNPLKLYSGNRVTVIKHDEEKNASFVLVMHNDGSKDYGWISTERLIGIHQITTNAIVGLSLLAFAIAITTVLLVVFLRRRKRIKSNVE